MKASIGFRIGYASARVGGAGRFTGWEPTYLLGLELRDALLGVVGFGRIGQAVARRALAFSMRVAYFDSTDPVVADDLRD